MHELLTVERRGSLAVLTLNRPRRRNALTRDLLRALPSLLDDAAADVAGIVLTGGPQVFSAGVDLAEIGEGTEDLEIDQEIADVAKAIRGLPVPVAAAVEGPCVGAAVELAMACDVCVVADDAFFRVPAVRLGALYRPEGIAAVVAAVGVQTATRLLVLGETIRGDAAVAAGLAASVTPPGHALGRALDLMSPAADARRAALDATKQVIQAAAINADLSRFDGIRRDLLTSSERLEAVARARGDRHSD